MNTTLEITIKILAVLSQAGQIKISRNPSDYVADLIAKSASRSSLLSMVEAFAEGMQSDIEYVSSHLVSQFMQEINSPDAPGVIAWLRKNSLIASSIINIKNRGKKGSEKERNEMFREALEEIEIESCLNMGVAMPGRIPQIPFTIQALSPLSHGADRKAGNSTLFRRQEVLSNTGQTLSLPIYGANAIRGIIRRELADDFTVRLGLAPSRSNPPYSPWFLAALYNGGSLSEGATETKALSKELGGSAMRIQGIHKFRDMVLPLSVMGVSLGNRVLCRHGFDNYPGEPICREWGTGDISESELFTWEFLTRKDDLEIRDIGSSEKSNQMIANTECLKRGILMNSGIDLMPMSQPLERSCVGHALELLFERGKIGANNRYGQGFVKFESHAKIPDSQPYKHFVETHKSEILDYLKNVGALHDDCIQLNLTSTAA